jgi:hypothetical protein
MPLGSSERLPLPDSGPSEPRAPVPAVPREKPLLLIDIDGVISLFGFDLKRPPAGSFHSIDGIPHYLSTKAGEHLLALGDAFDLVWCSGWEEKANEHLPHLLGVPAGLPYLRFERSPGRTNAHWKLAAIDSYAPDRPLAWIDDAFNEACHAWAEERLAPTLLVQTAPKRGLTHREAETLESWALELRRVTQQASSCR